MIQIKSKTTKLHYEAPDITPIRVDVTSPLLQSITLDAIYEEHLDW